MEGAQLDRCGVVSVPTGPAGKIEFLSTDTGGLVSDRDPGHIGFATATEIRANFNAGEDLFAGVIQAQQLVIGFQLRFKRDLARLQILGVLNEAYREYSPERTEPTFVFAPDNGGVQRWVVRLRDIAQFLGKDLAAIDGRAAGGNTFPVGDKGTGHE